MTIYNGTTVNGIYVDDMIDDNDDRVWRAEKTSKYFARLANYRKDGQDDMSAGFPAIVLFSDDAPFSPIYAKTLADEWNIYLNEYGETTKEFLDLLPGFFEESKRT
jgi:hypothetical protein